LCQCAGASLLQVVWWGVRRTVGAWVVWVAAWAVAAVAAWGVGAPGVARAWCQSCTVTRTPLSCAQPCYCPVETNEAAHPLYWDRACIQVSVEDDPGSGFTTEDLDAVVDRSFGAWTGLDCGEGRTPGFQIQRTDDRARCDRSEYVSGEGNANSVVVVNEGWTEREGHDSAAFALTTTFFLLNTGEIIDADMELNETNWNFTVCPAEGCIDGQVDLENTITHEAGHFFGLAHAESGSDATMWACADEGDVNKRTLEADDIEGMCTIYGEGALPEGCSFSNRGGFDPYCADDRDGCGCRVAGAPGRSEDASWPLLLGGLGLAFAGRRLSRRRARG